MSDPEQPSPRDSTIGVGRDLERGRLAFGRRAWADAHRLLSLADGRALLGVADLELLATSAYLIGRDDDYLSALERAHHAHLKAGETVHAARQAFWLGLRLLMKGDSARATGWLARARRLLEGAAPDCAERGYLLLPLVERYLGTADWDTAYQEATRAVEIGERCGEVDLISCARHLQGRALIGQGRVDEGLALLDEAMIAVIGRELSPVMTGLVYCSVIEVCQQIYALARAREWTAALAEWCEAQPQMIAFTGTCLVHRAEILQLHGAWPDAIAEARRACERHSEGIEQEPPAAAFYQEAEVHRLRGEYKAAEGAYREASRTGFEPQPGLALLRMAQGRDDAAAVAIRRVVSATTDPLQRAKLLPAFVEIMVKVGDMESAREASHELAAIADSYDTGALGAMAAQAQGTVDLAAGDAHAALRTLRRAHEAWRRVEAPYQAAQVRVLAGLACRALGDEEGSGLELDAARATFERLGAAPDLALIDRLAEAPPGRPHGLTPRELQVLRQVAAGKTNKVIAQNLFVSERTVDRHVSNIFDKLDVSSRTAATAYAYEHKLV